MKRGKLLTTVCILALSVSVALTAQAGPFGGGQRGHGPGGGLHGMQVLMQLDLSSDQKHAVYDILKKYEPEQEKARDSVHGKRQQMAGLMWAEEVNEEAIRQTFRETTAATEEAVVLRARMFAEIRSVLNDEQREQLAEIQQNKGERMAHRQKQRQFKRAVLKTWLQMDSE
jgi:Spy/CpxP family protein refolding chaperone